MRCTSAAVVQGAECVSDFIAKVQRILLNRRMKSERKAFWTSREPSRAFVQCELV